MKKKLIFLVVILICCVIFTSCKQGGKTELESVTISFVTNFDQIVIEPVVLNGVNPAYMPDDPTMAGYNFLGWFYDKECTRRFHTDDGLDQDITLYAKWQRSNSFDPPQEPVVVESGGFAYEFINGSYAITGYHGTKKDIVIPNSYNALPVTRIKSYAFRNNALIESVAFTSVLEKIEQGAFENCKNLSRFAVPQSDYYSVDANGVLYNRDKTSLIHVGMATKISEFVIPKSISIIQDGAFFGCAFSVKFENGSAYKAINENDFNGFKGMLTLGSNIINIEQYGLNKFLGTLVFDDNNSMTTIGLGAFDGYQGKKVVLPATISKIEQNAFYNCKGIIDISMANITTISKSAFSGYQGAELIIPSHIESLEESAFHSSTAKIIFEQGCQITTIPQSAFARFDGQVYLPSSVTHLQKYSFWALSGNAKVEFENTKEAIQIDEGAIDLQDQKVSFGVVKP